MSINFYIGVKDSDKPTWFGPAYRCDCDERYVRDFEKVEREDPGLFKKYPSPQNYRCDSCTDTSINMANDNARDIQAWLGIPCEEFGQIPAPELAALCRRRLWDEARNYDKEIEGSDTQVEGQARVISAGRREGYLRERTKQFLRMCEKAKDRWIVWS